MCQCKLDDFALLILLKKGAHALVGVYILFNDIKPIDRTYEHKVGAAKHSQTQCTTLPCYDAGRRMVQKLFHVIHHKVHKLIIAFECSNDLL